LLPPAPSMKRRSLKARCDTEPVYCIAWAIRLRDAKPPKLAEAKPYLQKACDRGVERGCTFVAQVDQAIQQAEATVLQVWQPVEVVADDVADKRWMIQYARQNHTLPLPEVLRAEAGILRYAHDKLCPVKKAFVDQSGSAEFTKRAAAHCKDHPPIGSGEGNFYGGALSGHVVLTSQCQAAFATPCP